MIVSHSHKFIFLKTKKTGGSSIRTLLARHLPGTDYLLAPSHPAEDFLLRQYGVYPCGFMDPDVAPVWEEESDWSADSADSLLELRRTRGHRSPAAFEHFRVRAHAGADQIRELVGERVFRRYFKFAFERNPWDRMVSLYLWNLRDDPLRVKGKPNWSSFEDFVRKKASHPRVCNSNIYCAHADGGVAVDHLARFEDFTNELAAIFRHIGLPFDSTELPRVKDGTRTESYRTYYGPETFEQVAASHRRAIELMGYEF